MGHLGYGDLGPFALSTTPIVAVVGATAAGKTSLSLDLAETLGGEIINTDAMQVYRGMDIGTAKLPVAERRGIPHHLLDLLEVAEPASVADFQALAREEIAVLREAGKTPVLVGGSALYTRAILDRFEFPGTSNEVRERLEKELETAGEKALHDRLRALDRSPPSGSRSTTVAASYALWRSSSSPASPSVHDCPSRSTTTRPPSRSASTSPAKHFTYPSGSASRRC